MDGSTIAASPQLLAANRRLHELRAQAQTQRQAQGLPVNQVPSRESDLPWDVSPAEKLAASVEMIAALPAHLGWGSEVLTAVLRRQQDKTADTDDDPEWWQRYTRATTQDSPRPQALNTDPQSPGWVKLYPDIGLGMLRRELTAPGRLWLMLRYLDQEGRGVLRIDIIKQQLTKKDANLSMCGKRQLRNLLRGGEGIFWKQDKERVWLYSATKVAYALGVERLTGRPVALPTAALLNGIGAFRAHLYTAFHSGRTKDKPGGEQAMPIARATLAELSGVGRSSQRAYEERVGVEVQANFAVGELSTKEEQENRAWEKRQALFELEDFRGQQGKKGKTYLAWQLPNSYLGGHEHRPKGRQRRINRKLKDLVMKGTPGNVEQTDELRRLEKVYYPTCAPAMKEYGRKPERDLYWKRHRTGNGRFYLWQQLGGG